MIAIGVKVSFKKENVEKTWHILTFNRLFKDQSHKSFSSGGKILWKFLCTITRHPSPGRPKSAVKTYTITSLKC